MILIKKIVVVTLQICRKDNGKKNQLSRGRFFEDSKCVFRAAYQPCFLCQKSVKKQSNTEGPIFRDKKLIVNGLYHGFDIGKRLHF